MSPHRLSLVWLLSLLANGCFDLSRTWDGGGTTDLGSPDVSAGIDLHPADGPSSDVVPPDLPIAGDVGQPDAKIPFKKAYVQFKQPMVFQMGSPSGEDCRPASEDVEKQHQVTLTRPFWILNHEVTQGEYDPMPPAPPCLECPAINVTWHEAAEHCNKLSTQKQLDQCYTCSKSVMPPWKLTCTVVPKYKDNKIYNCPGYRLPTEAEWEYAYRAGTPTSLYSGVNLAKAHCTSQSPDVDPIGWYKHNAAGNPHQVGQLSPNSAGLYDMAGNVWEWCHDAWIQDIGDTSRTDPAEPPGGSDQRVVRGGSFASEPELLRAASRAPRKAMDDFPDVGFRCVHKD